MGQYSGVFGLTELGFVNAVIVVLFCEYLCCNVPKWVLDRWMVVGIGTGVTQMGSRPQLLWTAARWYVVDLCRKTSKHKHILIISSIMLNE